MDIAYFHCNLGHNSFEHFRSANLEFALFCYIELLSLQILPLLAPMKINEKEMVAFMYNIPNRPPSGCRINKQIFQI